MVRGTETHSTIIMQTTSPASERWGLLMPGGAFPAFLNIAARYSWFRILTLCILFFRHCTLGRFICLTEPTLAPYLKWGEIWWLWHTANRHKRHHPFFTSLSTGRNPPVKAQTTPKTVWFSLPLLESVPSFVFFHDHMCCFFSCNDKIPGIGGKSIGGSVCLWRIGRTSSSKTIAPPKLDVCILRVISSLKLERMGYIHISLAG